TACSLIASPEPMPSQCRCGYMVARVALAWASTAGCQRNVGTATPGPISPRVRSASAVSTFHTNGACPWAGTHGASTSEAITPVKPCCSARTPASTASVGGSCSKAAAYPIWTMRGSLLSNADGMTAAVHAIAARYRTRHGRRTALPRRFAPTAVTGRGTLWNHHDQRARATPRSRRAADRHGVLRSDLHRVPASAATRHRGVDSRDGVLPRRDREPGGGLRPPGLEHQLGRGIRRRPVRGLDVV